jgi:hypothetical protein
MNIVDKKHESLKPSSSFTWSVFDATYRITLGKPPGSYFPQIGATKWAKTPTFPWSFRVASNLITLS